MHIYSHIISLGIFNRLEIICIISRSVPFYRYSIIFLQRNNQNHNQNQMIVSNFFQDFQLYIEEYRINLRFVQYK